MTRKASKSFSVAGRIDVASMGRASTPSVGYGEPLVTAERRICNPFPIFTTRVWASNTYALFSIRSMAVLHARNQII